MIDHIFTNTLRSDKLSGNLLPHITDHLPIFIILPHCKLNIKSSKGTYKRDYSHFDKLKFQNEVKALELNAFITSLPTTNEKYDYFHTKLLDVINKHAPMIKLSKRKQKQSLKPWITKGIRKSITKKNRLFAYFISSKNNDVFVKYKQYKNKLNHLIRFSKRNYYLSYFSKFIGNMSKIWQAIKELANIPTTGKSVYLLQEGDLTITDPLQIANNSIITSTKLLQN